MVRRNRNGAHHARLRIGVEFSIGEGCGKRRFDTYADAELVLAMALGRGLQGSGKRREIRIYRCSKCDNGFHLTSQELMSRDTPTVARPVD